MGPEKKKADRWTILKLQARNKQETTDAKKSSCNDRCVILVQCVLEDVFFKLPTWDHSGRSAVLTSAAQWVIWLAFGVKAERRRQVCLAALC